MDDRERLYRLSAPARRDRASAWGTTLLHTLPLLVASVLALLLGRPEVAAGALALVLLTLGLVRTLTRPRRLVVAPGRIRAPREVSRSR